MDERLRQLADAHTIARLWARDHELWSTDDTEISNRLGWLDVDITMRDELERVRSFVERAAQHGFTRAVLMGMGGSAMAPRVFAAMTDRAADGLPLDVLDSTVPEAIRLVEERSEPGRTLYLVSSKSGNTSETVHLMEHFWAREPSGDRFVAITDEGSSLHEAAGERGFRDVFLNPADIGGRYSALSYFGLVPAALAGVDVQQVLDGAAGMRARCGPEVAPRDNPGARLGVVLAEAALGDRDVLAIPGTREHDPFGAWLEQLVAESTGKNGGGILPIIGCQGLLRAPHRRRTTLQAITIDQIAQLTGIAGETCEPHGLGAEYYRWQFAVAIAGSMLGLNPFDQPDVEATKRATARFLSGGAAPADDGPSIPELLRQLEPDQYLAIHAYVAPSRRTRARLQRARQLLTERTGAPTALEYGPSLLHSTGQYHKAGRRTGAFIQIVDDDPLPMAVWHGGYTFGDLTRAEADGDRVALEERGRKVSRVSMRAIENLVEWDVAEKL